MKGQAVRIDSIHQEVYLWQSTAILGAVVGAHEGAIESIPGNEGRLAQAWVNVRGGLRLFSVYFWHSEGWTPRNEALLEKEKAIGTDACSGSERSVHMQVKRPKR